MAEITTAWVYVPTMGINSKQMKFDEVRAFCNEHGLGVWENEKIRNPHLYDKEFYKYVRKCMNEYGF